MQVAGKERRIHLVEIELLSCQDIVGLLNALLPRREATPEVVMSQMEIRHRKRRESIIPARRSSERRSLERLAAENRGTSVLGMEK